MNDTGAVFVDLSTLDLAYAVGRYPQEDTKTRAAGMWLGAGGPAANAAITHAFLAGPASRRTILVTALGQHSLALTIRDDLREHGVEIWDRAEDAVRRPPVSSIVVTADTGSRTIVSMDGSESDPVPTDAVDLPDHTGILLVDGHYPALALDAARRATGRIPVVLDGGRWRDDVHRDLLPLTDIAICSTDFRPPGVPAGDMDALFDFVHAAGPQLVAVTRGGRSIRYSAPGERGEIPAPAVEVVDTLGAGDILHGAFCHFHAKGEAFPAALRHAAEVATASCRYVGTREWMGRQQMR
ncbi:PfkB family carbohydrate kinase [Nocardia crassostreae]|uniref:PfkB family carbohydrate kinase n=1 Tax=Nocardia crassostreae TaxID=53428 RepID=UPI000835DF06|nr:PfkB family carbohydrate kinase [Nocardia crassostreae]